MTNFDRNEAGSKLGSSIGGCHPSDASHSIDEQPQATTSAEEDGTNLQHDEAETTLPPQRRRVMHQAPRTRLIHQPLHTRLRKSQSVARTEKDAIHHEHDASETEGRASTAGDDPPVPLLSLKVWPRPPILRKKPTMLEWLIAALAGLTLLVGVFAVLLAWDGNVINSASLDGDKQEATRPRLIVFSIPGQGNEQIPSDSRSYRKPSAFGSAQDANGPIIQSSSCIAE